MKINKLLLSMFLLSVLIISCDNDDNDVFEPKGDYENGLLISGEGALNGPSGSVSFVSNDFTTVEHLIYSNVNGGKELGKFVQSLVFDDQYAYICVDNQNSITVVDRYTFEEKMVITEGLMAPRYMTIVNGKGYATNWGSTSDESDDFVAVIDLNSFTVISTIPVGNGPERIIERNGKLYVSHRGAFTTNNIISIIDIASENTTEIVVNDKPDELFFDNSGNLIVLCEGKTIFDSSWQVIGQTPASISKINISNNSVTAMVFEEGSSPTLLVGDGNNLYYNIGSEIYVITQAANSLATNSFLTSEAALVYDGGMTVKDGILYLVNPSYDGLSKLDIYNLSDNTKIMTVAAPLGASKIYFN